MRMHGVVQVAKASVEGMERIVYVEVHLLAEGLHTRSCWQRLCSAMLLSFPGLL